MKIIAVILETPIIERILNHLGLLAGAPPRAPARAPIALDAVLALAQRDLRHAH